MLDSTVESAENIFALTRRNFKQPVAAFAATLLFAGIGFTQTLNNPLREELLAMRDRDQKAREDCPQGDPDKQIKCYAQILESVDRPNTKRLEEIVRSSGIPNVRSVRADGVKAFYLVLQHSPSIELKKKSRKAMKKAFEANALSAMDYANFTDRLLVNLGKRQIYGSNFEFKDGKLVMSAVKDQKNLNARRKKLGLPPIADYARALGELYKMEVVVPQ